MLKTRTVGWCGLLIAAIGCASGCGGNATPVPTITVKPAEPPRNDTTPASAENTRTEPSSEPASHRGTGNLKGRIVFIGPRPIPRVILPKGQAKRDGAVCAHKTDIRSEELLVSESGGLANVFFYLDHAPSNIAIPPASGEPAHFDQRGCVFIPHAMIVRTHQIVKVLSDDDVAHNVHTYPKRNTVFNQTVPPKDRNGIDLVYLRTEPTPLEVKCDLHTWMQAWHLPLDHPFGTVTDTDGRFEITGLPAGKYKFRIWHEKAPGGFLNRNYQVEIQPGENDVGTIPFTAKRFGLENHTTQ